MAKGIYSESTVMEAIKYYIPQKYQKTSSKHTNTQKDLTQFVTQFIERKTSTRNLLLLAAPGMGKTTFALNFYLHTRNRRTRKRHSILLVPLNLKDADQMIKTAPDKKKTVLFLDGLDEDIQAFQNPKDRLLQLTENTIEYKRVIITSNLNFISSSQINVLKKGYEITSNTTGATYHLYKYHILYFSPMTYSRAKKILDHLLPFWKNKTKQNILKYIQSNSAGITPFTLNYLPKILPGTRVLLSKNYIYEKIIQHSLKSQHAWDDKNLLNNFLGQLAVDLFANRHHRGEESIQTDELISWFNKNWGTDLKPFNKDTQTLISEDSSGIVRFKHRSIMEYVFVQQLMSGDKQCFQIFLTDEMKSFFLEILIDQTSDSLSKELIWLNQFKIKAQGVSLKSDAKINELRPSLFQTILNKNPQYAFLNQLTRLLKNPIFIEFGWDPKLYKSLKLAIRQAKSSFMELKEKHQNVLITSEQIEISQKGKQTKHIKLTPDIINEYSSMLNNAASIKLNRAVGVDGLQIIANLNRSGEVAVLPDLKTFETFTLFFWKNNLNTSQ